MKRLIAGLVASVLAFSAGAQYWRDGPQTVGQGTGLWYPGQSFPFMPTNPGNSATTLVMDATGEKVGACGYLVINDGSSSKTITGGDAQASISFLTGAVTWADATPSTLDVAIQDFDTANGPPARPDETSDVYGTITVGDGVMTSASDNTWITMPMETGSEKTMNAGALYCIVFDMTARAGSDSVQIATLAALGGRSPTIGLKTGGTWAAAGGGGPPNFVISFDDASLGWLDGSVIYSAFGTDIFNTGTAFDEYGLVCQVPFDAVISGVAHASANGGTGAFTYKVYSDPFGSPAVIDSFVGEPRFGSATTTGVYNNSGDLSAPVKANTPFAVTLLATSANNVTLTYLSVSSATHLAAHPGGTSCYGVKRDGSTGAFTPSTTKLPFLYFRLKKISVH